MWNAIRSVDTIYVGAAKFRCEKCEVINKNSLTVLSSSLEESLGRVAQSEKPESLRLGVHAACFRSLATTTSAPQIADERECI